MRTRRYLSRGSEQPLPGACGSRRAQRDLLPDTPWRFCTSPPRKGRTRCRVHGGNSLAGAAAPSFKSGIYSEVLTGSALAEGYEALREDKDILTLREQIRLLHGRSVQLLRRLQEGAGESGEAWRRAQDAVRALQAATASGSAEAFRAAAAELEAVVVKGAALERDHAELRAIAELRRRLVETEHRLLERGKHLVPVDLAIQYGAAVSGLATKRIGLVPSAAELAKWLTTAIAGRRQGAVALGAQLEEWLRVFGRKQLSEFAYDLKALLDGRELEPAQLVEGGEG